MDARDKIVRAANLYSIAGDERHDFKTYLRKATEARKLLMNEAVPEVEKMQRLFTELQNRVDEAEKQSDWWQHQAEANQADYLRLNAALAEIKKHLRDRGAPALLESQIDAIIDKARAEA